ncbi:(Fe-S)-binding protein [Sulfuriflexus mobilis]|uniref:(Fe-S)-binding protein n=1 Tax=Sulfuriflexus mobilis TaxID=1811807 RepID=UPI000F83EAFC|nr:(Fe-S)-binding protein [Sulfuriflexus mobilis]
MSTEPRNSALITESDKCVMCGMCLPQCPTYIHAQDENESPRGRLVLGKALLRGELKVDSPIRQHIDNCLLCRQCERICPSGVKFGYFMDGLRETLEPEQKTAINPLVARLENPVQTRRWHRWLRLAQLSGMKGLAALLPGQTGRLARSLPTIGPLKPVQAHYPATSETGTVKLFKGCTQTLFGNRLLESSVQLLNRLGVSVEVPAQQGCCGGLSQHQGRAVQANRLAAINIEAFAASTYAPILTLASGCAATLKDYARQADPDAGAFALAITDISHYLQSLDWPKDIQIRPLEKRIVIHSPCSLRNVMRQQAAVATLLARIPQATLLSLEQTTNSCCGAAGSYMFEAAHEALADTLADATVQQIRRLNADIVVTSNIGCAMNLQTSLKRAGLETTVLHPVELLAQQLIVD